MDGLTYEEMAIQFGDFLEKWVKDCTSVRPPGGCTLHELQDQVWAAVMEILERQRASKTSVKKDKEGVVLAVTHFFPILSTICKSLGLDLSECRRMRLDLASICTLDFNPSSIVLVSLNDTCHLR